MRTLSLLFTVFSIALPCAAQIPDNGNSEATGMQSGNAQYPVAEPAPAAAQDAEAAREKLLKASDQIDMIQSNFETTKVQVDGMKNDITQLQASNDALKQQIAALQAALDKESAERTKERQALVDEVSSLLASRGAPAPHKHHVEETVAENSSPAPSETAPPNGDSVAGGAESPSTEVHHTDLAPPAEESAPPPKPMKGYYHTVESGETLTMICEAYRDQGVKVTISQVRKANGLAKDSVLKVGQKLFIPKSGT